MNLEYPDISRPLQIPEEEALCDYLDHNAPVLL